MTAPAPDTTSPRIWNGLAVPSGTNYALEDGVFTVRRPLPRAMRIARIVVTVWSTPIALVFGVGGFPVGLLFALPVAGFATLPWLLGDHTVLRILLRRRWFAATSPLSFNVRGMPRGPQVHLAGRRAEGGHVALLQISGGEVGRTPPHPSREAARRALLPLANQLREAMGDPPLSS